ncbi:hypothetical protein [uncultured Tateyamaria sp.]|uniref:hypothetical protein n=1 Tax=Tateyamaria sp. 1078 TaxID=3417464 RepID=UPI0026204B8E|nr:hypothetical protein [uncultured Tateyamaria sp.]
MKQIATRLVVLLTAAALSLWVGFAQAHDGLHGQDLTISGLSASAAALDLPEPLPVEFAQDTAISTRLRFNTEPPGNFMLNIGFGAAGQGGVVVIPDRAQAMSGLHKER